MNISKFSSELLPGKSRITGSGRKTTPCPTPDKKGKWKRHAVEMWLLYEARIEASGNTSASLSIANIHAHNMKDQDYQIVHDILIFGSVPDCFVKL